jgi:CheY-like chemotaxis protein
MGGDIRVESVLGKGSKFIVRLPLEIVTSETARPSNSNKIDKSLRILIVEDSEMNRIYLEQTLTRSGHEWTSSKNGLEALEMSQDRTYDLILMDIRMPVMDGYEAAEKLRGDVSNPNRYTPIIALTASALLDEKEKALKSGMNQHLSKPFTRDQLNEAISQFFESSGNNNAKQEGVFLGQSIDTNTLNELFDSDWEHILLMMQVFMQNADQTISDLQNSFDNKDWPQLKALAHKIKPGLMMVGLKDCYAINLQLEAVLKQEAPDDKQVSDLFDVFMTRLKSDIPNVGYAIRQLKDYLAANPTS